MSAIVGSHVECERTGIRGTVTETWRISALGWFATVRVRGTDDEVSRRIGDLRVLKACEWHAAEPMPCQVCAFEEWAGLQERRAGCQ